MSTLQVAIVQAAPVPLVIGDEIDSDGRLSHAGESEGSLFAHLDFHEFGQRLASLDTGGYYSRFDVFELNVDTRAKNGTTWSK